MARKAMQVHIYIYRYRNGVYEYGIFQRSEDRRWWQGITGGVESGESLEEAARREILEESGISDELPLYRLDNISCLPGYLFDTKTREAWGEDVVVIPMYFFAMPYDGEIKLSHEHTGFQWIPFKQAHDLIYFHDQKVGLWELKERLDRGNLKR